LFYGFTRKDDNWFSTSCTLNSWISPQNGEKYAADVVLNAGRRGSDRNKADLINLMPKYLWKQVLPKLENLTVSYEGKPWTLKQAGVLQQGNGEELDRMRRLVFKSGSGSKLYDLDLEEKWIGAGGLSSVEALATVLQEKCRRNNKPRCNDIQRMNLARNDLTDKHIAKLAPMFSECSNLEWLSLRSNIIGDEGCRTLNRCLPRTVRYLELDGNEISQDGCQELMKLMELPSNDLEKISLLGNVGYNSKQALDRKRAAKKKMSWAEKVVLNGSEVKSSKEFPRANNQDMVIKFLWAMLAQAIRAKKQTGERWGAEKRQDSLSTASIFNLWNELHNEVMDTTSTARAELAGTEKGAVLKESEVDSTWEVPWANYQDKVVSESILPNECYNETLHSKRAMMKEVSGAEKVGVLWESEVDTTKWVPRADEQDMVKLQNESSIYWDNAMRAEPISTEPDILPIGCTCPLLYKWRRKLWSKTSEYF